jgi:hypothetical protein
MQRVGASGTPPPTGDAVHFPVRRGVLHTPARCIAISVRRVEMRPTEIRPTKIRPTKIRRVKTRRYSQSTPAVLRLRVGSMLGRTPEAFRVNNVGFQPGVGMSGVGDASPRRRNARLQPTPSGRVIYIAMHCVGASGTPPPTGDAIRHTNQTNHMKITVQTYSPISKTKSK